METTINPLFFILALLLFHTYYHAASSAVACTIYPISNFVHSSCRATRYPNLCEQTLSGYSGTFHTNPRLIAETALSISLAHAQSALSYVNHLSTLSSNGVVQDCVENMGSSVDNLRSSTKKMDRIGRAGSQGFHYQLNNVLTWCSAALTDITTCLDSFEEYDGKKMHFMIMMKKKVAKVEMITSNALGLVNRLSTIKNY